MWGTSEPVYSAFSLFLGQPLREINRSVSESRMEVLALDVY